MRRGRTRPERRRQTWKQQYTGVHGNPSAGTGSFTGGELSQPVPRIVSKTGTCGGPSNLTEAEGFHYHLHPYMAKKMRMENANPLYNVAPSLADTWQPVTLPHDATVSEPYVLPEAPSAQDTERGFQPPLVCYYRKVFQMPARAAEARVTIEFEGVMRDCTVWVNGCRMGIHLSGYTGFSLDVTEVLFYGTEGENVILVRTDTHEREGWWAEGAGIYRPVWLCTFHALHVIRNGVFVHCDAVSREEARVTAEVTLRNQGESTQSVTLLQRLFNPEGGEIHRQEQSLTLPTGEERRAVCGFSIPSPCLWQVGRGRLYRLRTDVIAEGMPVDTVETDFGVRSIAYTEQGLMVNGQRAEIKGVCVHQDFAGVGAALTPNILEYRLQRILAMGANAYRSAHHPADEALLSACDRLGILVMDKNRRFDVSAEGLADLEELALSGRNHPCVFMWSLENEELISTLPNGRRMLRRLVQEMHRLDPTRPCTVAGHYACRDEDYVRIPDVAGFNYDMGDASAMGQAVPGLRVIASEDGSFVSTRGVYADDRTGGFCSSYDDGSYLMKLMMEKMGLTQLPTGTLGGASSPNNLAYSWNHYRHEAPHLGGMFVWSAFDYRGETFPWNWPAVTSQYGAMDACGFEKDAFYYWNSLWQERPMLHLLPHWTWPGREGEDITVNLYSNCDETELFLNDISLGRHTNTTGMIQEQRVPYAPGTLRAVGYRKGTAAAEDSRTTAGQPARIRLTEIFGGSAETLIRAEILDGAGVPCPDADTELTFLVRNGCLVATANGSPADHIPAESAVRPAFHGLALAIVRFSETGGSLRAGAEGLPEAEVFCRCRGETPKP